MLATAMSTKSSEALAAATTSSEARRVTRKVFDTIAPFKLRKVLAVSKRQAQAAHHVRAYIYSIIKKSWVSPSTGLGVLLVLRNVLQKPATQHPHSPLQCTPCIACTCSHMDRVGLITLSRLIQTRPAVSLLMRLPPVGPEGIEKHLPHSPQSPTSASCDLAFRIWPAGAY